MAKDLTLPALGPGPGLDAASRPPKGRFVLARARRVVLLVLPLLVAAHWVVTRHRLLGGVCYLLGVIPIVGCRQPQNHCPASLYDALPRADDVFHFIPCTNATIPPSLEDPNPESTWQGLFEPNPDHWSWADSDRKASDACSGRGIYLCGYLDLPLDYYNASDQRIVRLAITKLQVAGLALAKPAGSSRTAAANCTSGRTIVLEPGGPGASGTNEVWIRGEKISQRLSDGELDVLGWDPRGVNVSLPLASCFAHNSYRDHWSLFADQYREASVSPMSQLRAADAMNKATFFACQQRFGDFGRFLSTTFAALDLEGIRNSLGEDDLSAYFVSYGTAVGQTYAAMFPDKVGRMVLDGNVYFKDYRTLGMDSYNSFANVTDVWVDGFLGECVRAGPDKCALAQSKEGDNRPVTLENLQARMESLIQSLAKAPIPAYLESTGPMLITYSEFVKALYPALYLPTTWASVASMLRELERGNTTAAAKRISSFQSGPAEVASRPFSFELTNLVVCADAHNSPSPPDDLQWWDNLWANYTQKSWLTGNYGFSLVFPCRHFSGNWREINTYQGHLNHTLKNPLLLLSSTYDPSTPLQNAKRALEELRLNARLVVHHGYGHATLPDKSNCTDQIAKRFMMEGELPEDQVSDCYANEKPYRYSKDQWF
ncbi:hypothetical protein NHJ13734_002968 [Beauveria thailandica]